MATEIPLSAPEVQPANQYNKRVLSWAWYDWADHAYITTTASTFFPPYFIAIAAPSFIAAGAAATDQTAQALARDTASNIFALSVSLALFVAAVLAPIIGAFADITGRRKQLLVVTTVGASVFSSLMFILTTGMWQMGLLLYFLSQVTMNFCLGFSSSLLPHVARQDDMNRVSSLGYAMGYVGGGVLLALNTALYLFSDKIGIDSGLAVRIAFLSVGIWWTLFTLPVMLNVPEPPPTPLAHNSRGSAVLDSFVRLRNTIRAARQYQELFKMLVAFWLYMEGIGAIILLATSYGAALGLNTAILIGTLLMTQFVAFPYALIYGKIPAADSKWRSAFVSMLIWTGVTFPLMGLYANLSGKVSVADTFILILANQLLGALLSFLIGRHLFAKFTLQLDTKKAVILGLVIYTLIPVWGFFLKTQAEFFLIGWLIGTVQGGTQALSRSIYASLTPRAKSGEFFGLYGLSEKFAGILGPLLYGIVGEITHDPRASILSISVFFVLGIYMLWRVDEQKGAQMAATEEAQIEELRAAD
ncbi:MAG: MFS transporter [Chloroflexi bacterium]|nr:MFS transporter [Chloroflexota bacterium]